MGVLRRLGIEKEGAVEPGAHEFGKNFQNLKGSRPSVLESHKSIFIYRVLDVLCWAVGVPGIPDNRTIAKASTVGTFVRSTFKGVSQIQPAIFSFYWPILSPIFPGDQDFH